MKRVVLILLCVSCLCTTSYSADEPVPSPNVPDWVQAIKDAPSHPTEPVPESPNFKLAAQATPSPAPVPPQGVGVAGWATTPEPDSVNLQATDANRMTLRERRALGLTFKNIRSIVLDLQKRGEIQADSDPSIVSLAVANELIDQNAQAYSELPPSFEWDSFLAFIEKIVELIMKIIGMFSYVMPTSYSMAA